MTDAETLDRIRKIVADYDALEKHQSTKPPSDREDMKVHQAHCYELIVRILSGKGKPR